MLYVKKTKKVITIINNNCKATATSWKDSNFKFLEPYSLYVTLDKYNTIDTSTVIPIHLVIKRPSIKDRVEINA